MTTFSKFQSAKVLSAALLMIGATLISPLQIQAQSEKEFAGKIFGREVPRAELQKEMRNAQLLYLLLSGSLPENTQAAYQRMYQNAWLRLILLEKAEKMGLHASLEQVNLRIQTFPLFLNPETGAFDKARYTELLDKTLPSVSLDCPETEFKAFIEEEIILAALREQIGEGVTVSDQEVEIIYHRANDQQVFEYAALPLDLIPPPEITREQAKAFFEENPRLFDYPAKSKVKLAVFPATDYTAQSTVSAEMVAQYYEANKALFASEGTGRVAPLSEVKDSITAQLTQLQALRSANEKCNQFLAEMGDGSIPLEVVAEKAGISVVSPRPFTAEEPMDKVDESVSVALQLAQTAFMLPTREESPAHCFSNPLVGQNAVYLMECVARYEAFPPESFEEVEENAIELALKHALGTRYGEMISDIQLQVDAALKEGSSFRNTLDAYGLTPRTIAPFTRRTLPSDPLDREVALQAENLRMGDTCLIRLQNSYAIVYVAQAREADIQVATPEELATIRELILANKKEQVFTEWQAGVVDESEVEDYLSK